MHLKQGVCSQEKYGKYQKTGNKCIFFRNLLFSIINCEAAFVLIPSKQKCVSTCNWWLSSIPLSNFADDQDELEKVETELLKKQNQTQQLKKMLKKPAALTSPPAEDQKELYTNAVDSKKTKNIAKGTGVISKRKLEKKLERMVPNQKDKAST